MGEQVTFTPKQIESAIDNYVDPEYPDDEFEASEFWDEVLGWGTGKGVLTIDGQEVPFEAVETDTGGEGHGEYVYVVFKVGDQTFKKEGSYFSHYGTDWDGPLFEVEAATKTITVWKKVKR